MTSPCHLRVNFPPHSCTDRRPNVSTNALLGHVAAQYTESCPVALDPSLAPSSDESWWCYVVCSVDCLQRLTAALQEEVGDASARLSMHQTTLLRERLEFVVALGLSPHLDPGVGLPVSARIFSGEQFQPPRQVRKPARPQGFWRRLL